MGFVIVYHKECRDGFCAAWVVHHWLQREHPEATVRYVAANYGETPPKVVNQDVIIVDFSYPRKVLEAMHEQAASLLVFDHHKNAASHCEGLPFFTFNNEKSGCRLAADHFGVPRLPHAEDLINYIDDRDRWQWQLPDSREVNAAIWSTKYSFKEWDALATIRPGSLAAIGEMVKRAQDRIIYDHVRFSWVAQLDMGDGSYLVRIANATCLASEIAEEMNKTPLADGRMPDFSIAWFAFPDGSRGYSLRSLRGSDVDVSAIARLWGGNGHKHAAGCRIGAEYAHPWIQPKGSQHLADPDHD